MISVGIDVSKGKSTICAMKPYGEILLSPKEYKHTKPDLDALYQKVSCFKEEIHFVMEATGTYHLPVSSYLKEKGYEVIIVNPLEMKRYRCQGIRNPKTDKIDAAIIAQYGIDFWYRKNESLAMDEQREELRFLGMQYQKFMKVRTDRCIALCDLMDRSMPGIYAYLDGYNKNTGKDRLCDFAEIYWHRDLILKHSEKKFIERYEKWAHKKGYRINANEACQLYALAQNGIPTLNADETTHMVISSAISLLRDANAALFSILNRMRDLAKQLPEYETVMAMGGVGESLGPRLMAEIGDVTRFTHKGAITAFAGVDPGVNESGTYEQKSVPTSKRGSADLRKTLFQVMDVLIKTMPQDDPVYQFLDKKRAQGKPYYVYMTAGANKFLRIYYGRVKEYLSSLPDSE